MTMFISNSFKRNIQEKQKANKITYKLLFAFGHTQRCLLYIKSYIWSTNIVENIMWEYINGLCLMIRNFIKICHQVSYLNILYHKIKNFKPGLVNDIFKPFMLWDYKNGHLDYIHYNILSSYKITNFMQKK